MTNSFNQYLVYAILFFHYGCREIPGQLDRTTIAEISSITASVSEVDSKFLMSKDGYLYFSKYQSGYYNLFRYEVGRDTVAHQISKNQDFFSPYLYSKSLCGLSDRGGNQQFSAVRWDGSTNLPEKGIKWISSSREGKYVIFQKENDKNVSIINCYDNTKQNLISFTDKFHGFSFSTDSKHLLISYDTELLLVDLKSGKSREIAENIHSEKLNPSLSQGEAYFVSNHESEFYRIYSIDIKHFTLHMVHATNWFDLRLPKRRGDFLFYVEVNKSQYLLKRLDLRSGLRKEIIKRGVVYDYVILNDSIVVASWSDLKTPKSINIFNVHKYDQQNISGKVIDLKLRDIFIDSIAKSRGYFLFPPDVTRLKGVIIFIHPGLNSDYSPRWETTLNLLCRFGYLIMAPNYLMSGGYGKTVRNAQLDESVEDSMKWKQYACKYYSDLPHYFLASSSGNVLMQRLLLMDSRGINAAISLFGIPSPNVPKSEVEVKYFLGRGDPIVNCDNRSRQLSSSGVNQENICIFEDEGHWIRRQHNLKKLVEEVLIFLDTHD